MKKILIIGGGFAGCAAADMLKSIDNVDITLVEKSPFLGAGVRTQWYGGHPYTFGPRHFLTQNEKVYNYLNNIVPLRSCAEHEFITYVEQDDAFYNYPINLDDVKKMNDYPAIKLEMEEKKNEEFIGAKNAKNLEEYWIGSVGKILFDKFIDGYNKKMWLVDDCKDIDTFNWSPKGVALKEGPKAAWDNAISAYPYAHNGYDDYFNYSTKGIKVLLSSNIDRYDIPNKTVNVNEVTMKFDIIVNTISPDILFDNCFGELPFLGRDFHKIVFPTEYVLPDNVYFLYYPNDEIFTRLVEFKKFTHHKSKTSLVGMEIPSKNGKHYPLPFRSEQKKANKYFDLMPEGVYSIGRAGSYLYGLDIDDCIWQSMLLKEAVLNSDKNEHPVLGKEYRFPEL